MFQLDVALEEVETQRNGLVFIYNMTNSKYSNFDYDLSQKMLTLLKGCYPARLKKVLIVTAPLWFKAPFKVLRLFVREKLRDRVFTVSIPQVSFIYSNYREHCEMNTKKNTGCPQKKFHLLLQSQLASETILGDTLYE